MGLVGAFTAAMMAQAFFAMTPFYGQEIGLTTGETPHFTELDPRLEPTQMKLNFESEGWGSSLPEHEVAAKS